MGGAAGGGGGAAGGGGGTSAIAPLTHKVPKQNAEIVSAVFTGSLIASRRTG